MASCGFMIQVGSRLVPCGKCNGCRRRWRRAWVGRMLAEQLHHSETSFVTLTYDEEHLPSVYHQETDTWIPTLVKSHPQKWLRSVRKKGFDIRYFCSGEYGEKYLRPHYHAIIFGLGPGAINVFKDSWNKGFVSAYEANPRTFAYVAKYCLKHSSDPEPHNSESGFEPNAPELRATLLPFRLSSRRPAIGARFAQNIGTSLSTRKGLAVLHDPSVHPEKNIRLAGQKYPLDATMRKHVKDTIITAGVNPHMAEAMFDGDGYVPTAEEQKAARDSHRIEVARGIHRRAKL